MPRISVLVKNEGQVTIGEGENALHVTYAPNAYTPMLEDMYQKILLQRLPAGAMAYLLNRVLKAWDLAEEDEHGDILFDANGAAVIVSTDLERLRDLPTELISNVVAAITEDISVSKDERKNLRRGSLAKRP